MYVRSAFWLGQPKPGMEGKFKALMDQTLIPRMRLFPGVQRVSALWPHSREDNPPEIACQVLVEFDNRADAARMLASAERAALRPQVMEVVAMFEGRLSHIEYEVGTP